ncbi:MAG: cupin domain-containing protein [Azospirillaceae bacterium]|nr:cupin domain-containing protein [Azospirillaceae bacterium]
MKIRRINEAPVYEAPNHYAMRSLRLQGFDPEGPTKFWTGLSHFLPGGGAGPDSSPLEKVYVILAGEMTVKCDGLETVLHPLDSCFIGPDEEREIVNHTNSVTTMLVVMPYPEAKK